MRFYQLLSVFLVAFLLNACSSKEGVLNTPLTESSSYQTTKIEKNDNDLSLILTFSGGGTRAAALSYGVLKELRDVNLLDKIDAISSVSGGSFTAAYYGLYGDKIFEDFEKKFLKKKIQTRLIDTILNPLNWFDYSLSNRSDYVANFYEEEIFGKKHFSDFLDKPKIIINATDISTGNAFSFTKENFAKICSDLDTYPVGKAVAASSAVPGVFSPITLQNFGYCASQSIKNNTKESIFSHNEKQMQNLNHYNDKIKYPFLHLIDGGITDNLGLRSLFHIISELDNNFIKVMQAYGIPNSNKIAIVVVNAADGLNPKIALNKENPDLTDTINATSTIQLKRYNADTLDILNYYLKEWKRQINEYRQENGRDINKNLKFYLIELNFNQLPQKSANILYQTETSLELPEKRVDELINAGSVLLRNSSEFQKLLKDIEEK